MREGEQGDLEQGLESTKAPARDTGLGPAEGRAKPRRTGACTGREQKKDILEKSYKEH